MNKNLAGDAIALLKTAGLLSAVVFLSGAVLFAQEPATLKQAVDKAIAASHGLQSVYAAREGAQAMAAQAGHMRLPVFSYESAYTSGNDPVYVFGSLLRQKQFTAADFSLDKLNSPDSRGNFSNALQMQIPLFTGFKISDYKRLGENASRQADASAGYARQGVAMEVISKYFMAALKGRLAVIAGNTADSITADLAIAQRLKDKGLVLGSDYYAAQSTLNSVKSAGAAFAQDALASAESLGVLTNGQAAGVSAAPPQLSRYVYEIASADALANGSSVRGDITAAELAAVSASIAKDMESNSILPQVGAFARLQTDTNNFDINPMRSMVGIGVSVPFGDFTRGDRIARRSAELKSANESARQLRQNAAAQLAEYRRNYESARAALPLAEQAIKDAEQSLELFRPLFRQGRQSVLDVVRTEYALMSARAYYEEQIFKLHSYHAAILFVSGALDESAVSRISDAVEGVVK